MPRGNGGIVGPVNTSFSGVWSLIEAQIRRSANTWPNFYSSLLSESATGSDAFAAADNADPYFEYTTLLLPGNGTNGAQNNTFLDGSTNNFTITRNGNTTQGTFSPFSQTGWGNYFSANTSELSFASNAAFNLSGVSWTIEFWTYPTENAPARDRNWITRRQASGGFTSSYQIYCGSGANTLKFLVTGQTVVTSTSSLTPNQWNHVAVVWNGTTLYFFINGVQDATTGTYGAGSGGNAEPLRIGRLATNDNVLSYMSNVRVVKGVAVYTGNFTVPSTPLAITQSSGTNISAITGTQTSLLTCQSNRFVDVTANAFVPTVGTGTSVQAFSPFNPTASWSAATYGGSGYFDGSGDYLTLPAGTAFAPGTGDFTVDGWFYTTVTTANQIIWSQAVSGTNYFIVWADPSTSTVYFNGTLSGGGVNISSTANLQVNAWNYFSVRRASGTVTVYLNGVAGTPTSNTVDFSNTSYVPTIGRYTHTATNYFTGYIANLRYVKGTAITPSGVPTTLNTAVSGTSALLNFTNAGIYDATSKNDLETVGDAKISTAISAKWGSGSMYFDGTGDYLLSPDQPIQRIGTGNFTIECWVYRNSSGTYGLVGKGTGTTGWLLSLNSSNQVVFTYGSSTITSTGTVSATTWTYIAVVREGTGTNQTKIYINGSNDGTGTVSTDFNQTNSLYVGADRTGGSNANVYLQDLRISNYARTITASPTAAFPTL